LVSQLYMFRSILIILGQLWDISKTYIKAYIEYYICGVVNKFTD